MRTPALLCVLSLPLCVLPAAGDEAMDKKITEGIDKIEATGSYAFEWKWRARNLKGAENAERPLTGEYLKPGVFIARIKNMEMYRKDDKSVINNGDGSWVPAEKAKAEADSAGRRFFTANAPRILRELPPPHEMLKKLPDWADKLRRAPRTEKVGPAQKSCYYYEGALKPARGERVLQLFKDMQTVVGNWAKMSAQKESTVKIYFGSSDNLIYQVVLVQKCNHGSFGKKENPWTAEEEITFLGLGGVKYDPPEGVRKALGLPDKDEWEMQHPAAEKSK